MCWQKDFFCRREDISHLLKLPYKTWRELCQSVDIWLPNWFLHSNSWFDWKSAGWTLNSKGLYVLLTSWVLWFRFRVVQRPSIIWRTGQMFLRCLVYLTLRQCLGLHTDACWCQLWQLLITWDKAWRREWSYKHEIGTEPPVWLISLCNQTFQDVFQSKHLTGIKQCRLWNHSTAACVWVCHCSLCSFFCSAPTEDPWPDALFIKGPLSQHPWITQFDFCVLVSYFAVLHAWLSHPWPTPNILFLELQDFFLLQLPP